MKIVFRSIPPKSVSLIKGEKRVFDSLHLIVSYAGSPGGRTFTLGSMLTNGEQCTEKKNPFCDIFYLFRSTISFHRSQSSVFIKSGFIVFL